MSIILDHITYKYMPETPYEKIALNEVTVEIKEREFIGIIGHTGSGKSTLIQHINGLLKPTSGRVIVDGVTLHQKQKGEKVAKSKVGMVFQYPEHQLFDETVFSDIAFGPRNLGLQDKEIEQRVRRAMDFVKLDFDIYGNRSPFQLSGGQMRRVAIAGVMALEPKYLILDEPSAGLDPRGKQQILGQIKKLHETTDTTVILISHDMDEIAELATRLIVMNEGQILLDGKPQELFQNQRDCLKQAGVDVPSVTQLLILLKEQAMSVDTSILTTEAAAKNILVALRRQDKC